MKRAKAREELEAYLAERVPEQLASRVAVLPAVSHIWSCFWELDSCRPISTIPVGMGASVPIREAIPWDKIGDWLTERGITDPWERESMIRPLIRKLEAIYRERQTDALKGLAGESESDG